MATDPVRAIADAVLYEGYILWPYRRSALKNRRRFTFGGVYPPAHSEAHPDDPAMMQTEVLVTGEAPVDVTVRFLQVVERTVLDGQDRPVEELEVGGRLYLSWQEAVEREVAGPGPVRIPAGEEREELGAGALLRSWEALDGLVELGETLVAPGVRRITVTVRNETPAERGGDREDALKRTFCSTHTLLHATDAEFVSATDPPKS